MDIDTKSIQVFLWKVLNFTLEACYNIVQAYPKTSLVVITVLFLYVFLPLVLVVLVCSLIASAIGVVVYRVYFRDDLEGLDNIRGYKKTDDKSPIVRENEMGKNVISLGQSQAARRRNVTEKDRESYAQRNYVDKDVARRAGRNDDLFDKTAVVEEDLKEIREVDVHSGKKRAGPPLRQPSHIVASPPFTSGSLEEGAQFSGVKGEELETSDDSEEDGRDRNKAVEWSFDDQMNLSHVGNIEMERNTRLENLIARRRARKLLDIHVRNTLMRPATNDSPRMPSIITARKNHFLSSTSELSPLPGSAPSVLLPMHKSPFDISFDPEKEKPIPTGDSFEKEILADQQKEATLCRHESFGRNAFSPVKSLQDRTNQDFTFHQGPLDKNEVSRTVHQPESSHGNEEDGSEVETKQIVHEKISERSRSSSSSEEDIPLSGADKDRLLKSLSSLAQKDTDSDRDEEIHVPYNTDRLLYEKTEGNSFFGEKRTLHAPSNSLASDLQVEISEIGSPHSTSSNDKSYIFDDYINKEVTSGGEDTNESNTRKVNEVSEKDITDAGVSSTNHNLDSNTSDLREVNGVSEKNITDAGVSSTNHNLDSNTSASQPEKVVRQEESSSHSQPSHVPDSIQGQTTGVKPDHPASSDATDAPSKHDLEDSAKEVIAHTSTSEKLKEAYPEEVNVVEESVVHNNDANEYSKSREVIEPQAVAEVSTPVEGINSESLKDTSSTPNKQSDLNISNASDQKNSLLPVSEEKDPSASQNMPTQDREDSNVSSHNDKLVTIENEANTKPESAKDSESDDKSSSKHMDLVGPSNPNNSKAMEDIKNIDSDMKYKELQEAGPHKDISQHLEADGNDNRETIKVVERDSTSTPNEAVVASKRVDLMDDSGKTMGHMEVKGQLDPHQGNSTIEGNIVSNDNETVNSAAEEKEIKPASESTKKDEHEKVNGAAEEKEIKPASAATKKDDNERVNSAIEAKEAKEVKPASESTRKDEHETVNSAAEVKEIKSSSAATKKDDDERVNSATGAKEVKPASESTKKDEHEKVNGAAEEKEIKPASAATKKDDNERVNSATEAKEVKPASESTRKDEHETVNSATEEKEIKPSSAATKKDDDERVNSATEAKEVKLASESTKKDEHEKVNGAAEEKEIKPASAATKKDDNERVNSATEAKEVKPASATTKKDDNERVNSATETKEVKSASESTKKDEHEKVNGAAEAKEIKPASAATKKDDNERVNSATEAKEVKPASATAASESTKKDEHEKLNSAAEVKDIKPASAATKKDDNERVNSATEAKEVKPASAATKKDEHEKVNSAAEVKEVKPASAEKKKGDKETEKDKKPASAEKKKSRGWKFF